MELSAAITRLEASARVLEALVSGVSDDEARWRSSPDRWSILEVVNHLADEEVRDFRTRVDLTLHRPGETWPPIDPERWVGEERYAEQELGESLRRFLDGRAASLAFLERLVNPQWERSYAHPSMGEMRADDVLAAWVVHDLLHIRQINRLRGDYWMRVVAPGRRTEYAGEW